MPLDGSVFSPNGISYRGSYFSRGWWKHVQKTVGGSPNFETHPSQYLHTSHSHPSVLRWPRTWTSLGETPETPDAWGGSLVTSYLIWIRYHEVTHLTTSLSLAGGGWWHDVRRLIAEIETQTNRYTLWFVMHSCYDSCYSCCWLLQVPIPLVCWIFLLRYKMLYKSILLRVWTPKTQVYWSDFWRDTFPVTIWMFAALHCEGSEELIMCRHPEERPCVKENIQIFWATLYFWFLITSNYSDMFVHRIAPYDAIWAYPRGTV